MTVSCTATRCRERAFRKAHGTRVRHHSSSATGTARNIHAPGTASDLLVSFTFFELLRGMAFLCRAAFEGDAEALERILRAHPLCELSGPDRHGLTALHVAAMRNNALCVNALLNAGFYVGAKSRAGWVPIEEAAAYKSLEAARALAPHLHAMSKSKVQDKLVQLGKVLKDMPDCAFEVSPPVLSLLQRAGYVAFLSSRH
jgi:Ankyrin repeats (3 copies)